MRIAWVGPLPPLLGGVAQHGLRTTEALIDAGHAVHVESWRSIYPSRFYPMQQPLGPGRMRWWNPVSWVRAGRRCRGADLVVISWVTPFHAIALRVVLATSGGTRAVLMAHNALPHEPMPFQAGLLRLVARRCHGAVAHATTVPARLRELTDLDAIEIVPHPPNLPLVPTPLPPGPPNRVLFFGVVRPYKGIELALDAVAARPELHLTIAGESWDPRPDELESEIAARGLSDRVDLRLGYLDDADIASLFDEHHLLVAPYRDATVSGVVPLAHAAGRPVVVTPVGGLPEAVTDGVDGVVAVAASAEAVGEAIDRAHADLESLAAGAARARPTWAAVARALVVAAG